MPGAIDRLASRPRVARGDAAAALRALLDGLDGAAIDPTLLHQALVALLLRAVFLRLAGDPLFAAPPGWRAFSVACARVSLPTPLFDPQRHPLLTTLRIDDRALARALTAITALPSLGAAHEALLALRLEPDPTGRLEVRPSDHRRRSGSHYTPDALAAPLVATTLRPLLGEDPTPAQILDLRICDPALGCGVFLRVACEQLTAILLRAWTRHGAPDVPDLPTLARGKLARECLYGVDRDPLAVELARLSLWLHVADPTLPLASFESTLRHGDSLVGTTHRDAPLDEASADAHVAAVFAGKRGLTRTHAILPLHWPLAFPRVFTRPRPGFDAMLGNPPYFWGNRIGRAFGEDYRRWLKHLHPDAHGNSDLAAHFLRRAFDLLRDGGGLGFITTNSISEAETRKAGLDHVAARGGVIHHATRDLAWPGDASVRVAIVCVHRGPVDGPHHLDGRPVPAIASDLRPPGAGAPPRLPARAAQSFKGVDFGGAGFLLSASARDALLQAAPHEAPYIWPVLNASGLTRSPGLAPTGHIINLGGLTLDEAAAHAPHCLEHLRHHVLPRRMQDRRSGRRDRWWNYNEACPGLYRAIAGLPRVLVGPVVATHLVFAFVAPRVVFTNALNIFTFSTPCTLALLQSRIHALWAAHHGSSLRTDLRYNPTTCFETFPFPPPDPALALAGQIYDEHRAALMSSHHEGLTKIYHRFHDPAERAPDIDQLRHLHDAIDRAVLGAFGWTDLDPRCEFLPLPGTDRLRLRWPQPLADEVLARLASI
ncbi:MAG TPA: DNA methyltransferase [Nannocystis sp.]